MPNSIIISSSGKKPIITGRGRSGIAASRPIAATTIQPFFADNLEGGKTNSANGFTWSGGGNWVVSSDYGFDGGTHSFKCTFGPDAFGANGLQGDGNISFSLGRGLNEIWVEWKIRYPLNYFHRNNYNPGPPVTGKSDNNKVFALWATTYSSGYQQITIEALPDPASITLDNIPTGNSSPRPTVRKSLNGVLSTIGSTTTKMVGNDGTYAGQIGTDIRMRVHFRKESTQGAGDGYFQWWVNETAMISNPVGDWGTNDPVKFPDQLSNGYFVGSSNSGFTDPTTFYLGAVKFYDTNPGWV